MAVRLIDVSGGFSAAMEDKVRAKIKIGDRVILFDTEPHNDQVMATQEQIDTFVFHGGGGTLIDSSLALIESTDPEAVIYCYTDGYFGDGFGFRSEAVQRSLAYKEGRLWIILWGDVK